MNSIYTTAASSRSGVCEMRSCYCYHLKAGLAVKLAIVCFVLLGCGLSLYNAIRSANVVTRLLDDGVPAALTAVSALLYGVWLVVRHSPPGEEEPEDHIG